MQTFLFQVKGFSVEKEDVTEKVRETIAAQEEEIAFNSDDMFLRKRLNLPLTRLKDFTPRFYSFAS